MGIFPYITSENLIAFLLVCFVIEITPGPNMAFLTIVSATKGRDYGFATVLGVTLGLLLISFAAAAGLATVLSNSPILFHGLRFCGVLYLLWLAMIEWRDNDIITNIGSSNSKRAYFRHGLIINILNPKATVFYVTILPGFIAPEEFVFQQAVTLTLISVCIATLSHIIIVTLAGFLKPQLDIPKRKRLVRRSMSVLLVLIAIWIGIQG